jgi:hypothetical protein
MVPAKLSRHFATKHSPYKIKKLIIFNDCWFTKQNRKIFEKRVISEEAEEASYSVAELIAQRMKSHTAAEGLVMPACTVIVRTVLGKEAEIEIDKVTVSHNIFSK